MEFLGESGVDPDLLVRIVSSDILVVLAKI